ncbi:MAG: hypothetical protein DWI57_13380 [Chloroflexi bacterium]|nr:MAG: hypothetical protein DWI57_13380 [Chloroflexota bacterium]
MGDLLEEKQAVRLPNLLEPSEDQIFQTFHLFGLPYHLRTHIPVRVVWEAEMGGYVAYEEIFGWYGVGDTRRAAMRHLAEVIVEDFEDLQQDEDRLLPDLQAKLHLMREILVYAR